MNYNDLWSIYSGGSTKGPLSEFSESPFWTRTMEEQLICLELEKKLIEAYRKINETEQSKKSTLLKNLLTVEWLTKIIQNPRFGPAIRAASLQSLGNLSEFYPLYGCTDKTCFNGSYIGPIFINPPKSYHKKSGLIIASCNDKVECVDLCNSCAILKEKKPLFSIKKPTHMLIQLDRDNYSVYAYLERENGMSLKDICPQVKHSQDLYKSLKFEEMTLIDVAEISYEKIMKVIEKRWENIKGKEAAVEYILERYCLL